MVEDILLNILPASDNPFVTSSVSAFVRVAVPDRSRSSASWAHIEGTFLNLETSTPYDAFIDSNVAPEYDV